MSMQADGALGTLMVRRRSVMSGATPKQGRGALTLGPRSLSAVNAAAGQWPLAGLGRRTVS